MLGVRNTFTLALAFIAGLLGWVGPAGFFAYVWAPVCQLERLGGPTVACFAVIDEEVCLGLGTLTWEVFSWWALVCCGSVPLADGQLETLCSGLFTSSLVTRLEFAILAVACA